MTSINDLRNAIADALAQEKAYNLPSVCQNLGLEGGDAQEAFNSKRNYVRNRLINKPEALLIELGQRVLREYSSESLLIALRDFEPERGFQIKPGARKNLIDELLLLGHIGGTLTLTEFLSKVWPLKSMPSTDPRYKTADDDIWKHIVDNDDWTYDYLFGDYLKLMDSTDDFFIRFLEQLVHPQVRQGNKQKEYLMIINKHLVKCGYSLEPNDEIAGHPIYRGVSTDGVKDEVKNLIFAANGPKPEIVLADSLSNRIEIVKHAEYCLVYDLPIPDNGLSWEDLVSWWSVKESLIPDNEQTEFSLYRRLKESLSSPPEKLLFDVYFKSFRRRIGSKFPALVPQVYLHFDPKTLNELEDGQRLPRQRMDFLMLLSKQIRIVIEVDGKHHYADEDKASPNKYAQMVSADRDLRLNGYELYRFGGYELSSNNAMSIVENFFERLFNKYGIFSKTVNP